MPFNILGEQFSRFSNFKSSLSGGQSEELIDRAKEFIPGKLYFACTDTLPADKQDVHYFTIDDTLVYINFHNDFGPNNISHTLRFIEILSAKFRNAALAGKRICLYTNANSDRRANAAYLICAYMLIVHRKTPEQAHAPIDGFSPPFVPFRDAGYGGNTYQISILDCLCGLYKGLILGLLRLDSFELEQYEFYERVENGDFNWVTDKFMALASPQDDPPNVPPSTLALQTRRENELATQAFRSSAGITGNGSSKQNTQSFYGNANGQQDQFSMGLPPLPRKFYSCYRIDDMVHYLKEKKVGTIIRLNNRLYNRKKFVENGIEHIEMHFPDGSNPPEPILKAFLEIVESRPGPIAVHCKAGLGRTGSLIACYLMKHYLFTASEVIAFLRVMRPGSVVGPQQNWLQSMEQTMWKLHPTVPLNPAISRLQPATYFTNTRFNHAIPQDVCKLTFVEGIGYQSSSVNKAEGFLIKSDREQYLEQQSPSKSKSGSFHSLGASDNALNRSSSESFKGGSNLNELTAILTKKHRQDPDYVIQEKLRHAAKASGMAIPVQPRKGVANGSIDEAEFK